MARKVSEIVKSDAWNVDLRRLHKDTASWVTKQVESQLTSYVNRDARNAVADLLGPAITGDSAKDKVTIDAWVKAHEAEFATMRNDELASTKAAFHDGTIGTGTTSSKRETVDPPRVVALMPLFVALYAKAGQPFDPLAMTRAQRVAFIADMEARYGEKFAPQIAAAIAASAAPQTGPSLDALDALAAE